MKRSGIIIAMGAMLMLSTLPGCSFYNKVANTASSTVNKIGNIVHKSSSEKTAEAQVTVEKKAEDKKTAEAKKATKVKKQVAEKRVEATKNTAELKKQVEVKVDKVAQKADMNSVSAVSNDKAVLNKEATAESLILSDREDFTDTVEEKAYTSKQLGQGVIKGDWAIEKVNGKAAVGEDVPFIKFVPEEGRIYGNNGCNVINGEFKYNAADSTVTFSNLASTMRLCNKDGLTDYEINAALDLTRYYELKIVGDDYYLYLLDGSRREVMSLMHQNFQFLNGTWNVSAINGSEVDEPDMHLVVDVDEGKIHGNTGCNILNGNMEIDMEKANSISFSKILTTRMACPPGSHQTEFLVALEEASSAKPLSKESVVLLNSQGEEVLRLVRPTSTEAAPEVTPLIRQ